MSLNTLSPFPVENLSINLNSIQLTFLVLGLVEFLFLSIFLDKKRIYNFFWGYSSSIRSHFIASSDSKDHAATKKGDVELSTNQEKRVDQSVCREEIELVLRSLGVYGSSEEATLLKSLDFGKLVYLFEEENPRVEEVKEAFHVFDKNRDGFIDATELQSILCALGLKQGSEIENCRRMIGAFDDNGDGRIDFDEFVKFMETSLC